MSKLTKSEKVGNIMAFLCLLFGENTELWNEVMKFSPDYLIEKFQRYVLSERIEYPWGLHPSLRSSRFDCYVWKWVKELLEDES